MGCNPILEWLYLFPLFSSRLMPWASLQRWLFVDAGTWCKRSLNRYFLVSQNISSCDINGDDKIIFTEEKTTVAWLDSLLSKSNLQIYHMTFAKVQWMWCEKLCCKDVSIRKSNKAVTFATTGTTKKEFLTMYSTHKNFVRFDITYSG